MAVDIITHSIAQIDVPLLTTISFLINHKIYGNVFLSFLFLFALISSKKKASTLISVFLTVVLFILLKDFYGIGRPCFAIPSKVACPTDYSFPSGHVSIGACLTASVVGTVLFIPYLLMLVLISFSRMYLGVHMLNDIVGGIVLGVSVFFVVDKLFTRLIKKEQNIAYEKDVLGRRLLHIGFGTIVILFIMLSSYLPYGFYMLEFMLAMFFLIGFIILDAKLKGIQLPIIDYLIDKLERPHALPAEGAFWYGLGVLLAFSYVGEPIKTAAVISLLAFGDGLSTLIGRKGRIPLPYNKRKTLEGTAAFLIGGSLSYFFVGPAGILLSLLCAIVETFYFGIDDNFLVPLTCVIVLRLGII
ncbi:MAG: phosphatase PAP2 family protein [Candidatus Micrarchaeia archaeon]